MPGPGLSATRVAGAVHESDMGTGLPTLITVKLASVAPASAAVPLYGLVGGPAIHASELPTTGTGDPVSRARRRRLRTHSAAAKAMRRTTAPATATPAISPVFKSCDDDWC